MADDNLDSLLWHLPALPDAISGNTEVNIIDSCIDFNNKALSDKIADQQYIAACNEFFKSTNSSEQYYIHGTCMAGIIGARETQLKSVDYYQKTYPEFKVLGVAKDAYFKAIAGHPNLDDVKTIIDTQTDYGAKSSPEIGEAELTKIEAHNKETNSGVKYHPEIKRANLLTIINSSGGQKDAKYMTTSPDGKKTLVSIAQDWTDFLIKLCNNYIDNQIIVASAGNDKSNITQHIELKIFPSASNNPQACTKRKMKHIISVACLNQTISDQAPELCANSNYGNAHVDLAAPGASIPCPVPKNLSHMPGQGTSQAAAVTTGTIALLKGCDPYANATEILNIIFSKATIAHNLQSKIKGGKVLNITAAVQEFCFNKKGIKLYKDEL